MKLPDPDDDREIKFERYVKDSYRFTENPLRDEVKLWLAWFLFLVLLLTLGGNIAISLL